MGIRILVGTEPGSDFGHACFFDSSRDIVFGPLFYESGKPHFLDPGDIAEAFGKWVGWDALALMTVEEMKDKAHELARLLERDPKEASAAGIVAGKLGAADCADSLGVNRPAQDALDEYRDDAWGSLSTDGKHPWAIVVAQEEAWQKGFAYGFQLELAGRQANVAPSADDRQREADAAKYLGASGDPDGVLG